MSLSGDKGVAQFKKSVKMGHPSGGPRMRNLSHSILSSKNVFKANTLNWKCNTPGVPIVTNKSLISVQRRQITGMPGSWLNLCSCLALNLHWASVDGQHLGAGGLPGQRTPRTGDTSNPHLLIGKDSFLQSLVGHAMLIFICVWNFAWNANPPKRYFTRATRLSS